MHGLCSFSVVLVILTLWTVESVAEFMAHVMEIFPCVEERGSENETRGGCVDERSEHIR